MLRKQWAEYGVDPLRTSHRCLVPDRTGEPSIQWLNVSITQGYPLGASPVDCESAVMSPEDLTARLKAESQRLGFGSGRCDGGYRAAADRGLAPVARRWFRG